MKRNISLLLLLAALMLAALLSSCNSQNDESTQTYFTDYSDFRNKRIGVITGSVIDALAELHLNAAPVYYADTAAAVEDVRRGRIAGFMTDRSAARAFVSLPGNDDMRHFDLPGEYFSPPIAIVSAYPEIIERFNEFLEEIKDDGTFYRILNRWMTDYPDLESAMPTLPNTGENGTLTVAVSSGAVPFVYTGRNGEIKGFSVEFAIRFAAHENMYIQFVEMDFVGLINHAVSGKSDFAIADISITGERREGVVFSDPIYSDYLGIIALRQDNLGIGEGGIINWLQTGIERNLLFDNRWRMIIDGIGVTMIIAILSQLFGTVFGCFVCCVLIRGKRLVKLCANLFCGFIYGTPMLVVLMIAYYVIFGTARVSNVAVAIAAFTLITGASIAQNLKAALDAVDPLEIEAARSIGLTAYEAFTSVSLPQMIRTALPGYTHGFIELVKSTSIVGYIAIQDITRAGDIIRSRTYDAYFPILFVAVVYLVVTTLCVQLFKFILKLIDERNVT